MVSLPEENDQIAERASVRRILEAIIREAEFTADLVVEFLKQHGLKPHRRPRSDIPTTRPSGPAADFVLDLGAAIRLRMWERGGMATSISPNLPASADALIAAANRVQGEAISAQVADLQLRVFQAWFENIARDGQPDLGTDVLLPTIDDPEELLDQVADFLWRHRHLAVGNKLTGGQHGA